MLVEILLGHSESEIELGLILLLLFLHSHGMYLHRMRRCFFSFFFLNLFVSSLDFEACLILGFLDMGPFFFYFSV